MHSKATLANLSFPLAPVGVHPQPLAVLVAQLAAAGLHLPVVLLQSSHRMQVMLTK
jgi:hypothetical protein